MATLKYFLPVSEGKMTLIHDLMALRSNAVGASKTVRAADERAVVERYAGNRFVDAALQGTPLEESLWQVYRNHVAIHRQLRGASAYADDLHAIQDLVSDFPREGYSRRVLRNLGIASPRVGGYFQGAKEGWMMQFWFWYDVDWLRTQSPKVIPLTSIDAQIIDDRIAALYLLN